MSVSLIDGHIDDDVMTDEQIIKAYEDKVNLIASMTSVYLDEEDGFDLYTVMSNALDLINRQRAENERLQEESIGKCELAIAMRDDHNLDSNCNYCIDKAKAEAIKEFAERLHEYINGIIERHEMPMFPFSVAFVSGMETKIDNLVKEMVGEG